jgi:hypothetical protein
VTHSLLGPLSTNKGAGNVHRYGREYRMLLSSGSSGISTFRLCTAVEDKHRSCLIRHRQLAFTCISSYISYNSARVLHLDSFGEILCTGYEVEYEYEYESAETKHKRVTTDEIRLRIR